MTSPTHRELAAMAREFNGRADDCGRLARAVLAALEQQAVPQASEPAQAEAPSEREALRGLLEIEEERIATGAFKPNPEAMRRIEAARTALATQQAVQAEPVAINYVILHDFAQRKRVSYNELCTAVNDAIKSMATPPAPGQVERDRDDACESALSSLIDLIRPGLDSGDILADAQEAEKVINAWKTQP